MFVELVYDKRNFDGLPGAKDIILGELTRRVHRIFPYADIRVKPMMTLPAASKHEKEQISRTVQEMFEEADVWLVQD
ncbi:DinI-like family protein [Citrobacter werkmanii]|uniref:DinI-like family protein n=1 Tax=Citrobacter werkmanii TaxID=67827 RepID=UPI00050632C2|nr:DinI-like family protein [Citrobacter werkmanii]UCA23065.1 DinI family protein [Citrobacter werkmanii]GAL44401.1 putative virulence protein MsgA homolog [Citrobacter werkmanii NBRC 105721]